MDQYGITIRLCKAIIWIQFIMKMYQLGPTLDDDDDISWFLKNMPKHIIS